MKVLRLTLAGCLVAGLAGCGSATTKPAGAVTTRPAPEPTAVSNKDKIVGVWELTKSAGEMPPGATVEFTRDGKMKATMKGEDGKPVTMDGTYTVDGEKVTTTMKDPGGKEHKDTLIVTKLTDKELITKDEKGKSDEFKKK